MAATLMLLPGLNCDAAVWAPQVAAISHAPLVIVEHSGHMCTMEQAQAVNAALAAWLRR